MLRIFVGCYIKLAITPRPPLGGTHNFNPLQGNDTDPEPGGLYSPVIPTVIFGVRLQPPQHQCSKLI